MTTTLATPEFQTQIMNETLSQEREKRKSLKRALIFTVLGIGVVGTLAALGPWVGENFDVIVDESGEPIE